MVVKLLSVLILSVQLLSVAAAEEITLSTGDGFTLAATLHSPSEKNGGGIILIHQGGSNRGE